MTILTKAEADSVVSMFFEAAARRLVAWGTYETTTLESGERQWLIEDVACLYKVQSDGDMYLVWYYAWSDALSDTPGADTPEVRDLYGVLMMLDHWIGEIEGESAAVKARLNQRYEIDQKES